MARRLEFSDEFVLSDGSRLKTPAELLGRLARTPDLGTEVVRRVAEGEVERWLSEAGWGPLAQRVTALRQRKRELEIGTLVEVLRGGGASVGGAPEGRSASETIRHAPGDDAGGASPRSPVAEAHPVPAAPNLLERQRDAIRAFLALEETRRKAEESAASRIQREEIEARRLIETEQRAAEGLLEQARERSKQAFERLEEAGLPPEDAEARPNRLGGSLRSEATGIQRLTSLIGTKLNDLAQLRERISTRNTFLIRAGVVLGLATLGILGAEWASHQAQKEANPPSRTPDELIVVDGVGRAEGGSSAGTEDSSSSAPERTLRSTGTLEIRSNVAEDLVVLDGRELGPSPKVLDVSAGRHTVQVQKSGCTTATTEIVVERAETKEVRLVVSCTTAQDLVARAQKLFESGEYDRAIVEIENALELNPGFEPAERLGERIRATKRILEGKPREG